MVRLLWLAFGGVCVGLAIAGAALPLLPTTPFLLLAVFAFARSSQRLHDWLVDHRHFGPMIRNWREHGGIDRRSKLLAVAAMLVALLVSWAVGVGPPACCSSRRWFWAHPRLSFSPVRTARGTRKADAPFILLEIRAACLNSGQWWCCGKKNCMKPVDRGSSEGR